MFFEERFPQGAPSRTALRAVSAATEETRREKDGCGGVSVVDAQQQEDE
jgi:hypothetical protein